MNSSVKSEATKVVVHEYLGRLTLTSQQSWIMEDLKKDIQKNGVKEPLSVDEETGVLVDGYKRHKICQELKIPFQIKYVSFESLTDIAKEIVITEANKLKVLKDKYPPKPDPKKEQGTNGTFSLEPDDPYWFYVVTLATHFENMGLEERDSIDISQEAAMILGYVE